jgi:uncharacterized protein YvpB
MISVAILASMATLPQLLAIRPNATFAAVGQETVLNYSELSPNVPFTDVIASWNVKSAAAAKVRIELRGRSGDQITKWYRMADWAYEETLSPRQSLNGQRDENGNVETDTLVFRNPMQSVDLRVTLSVSPDVTDDGGPLPKLDLLTLAFSKGKVAAKSPVPAVRHAAWGRVIDVPQRAQGNYPRGNVLCSATSTSMMLWHYAKKLNRPEIDRDVPLVEAKVWDSVYKGAGNWPFNTAFAGSFDPLQAYVARFSGIEDLERWIEVGLPVVCSVSFDLVRGKPLSPSESGHLVVLVGFTKNGDPVFNDPARKEQVRYTYTRQNFENGWAYSGRTVYVIHPSNAVPPPNSKGMWLEKP